MPSTWLVRMLCFGLRLEVQKDNHVQDIAVAVAGTDRGAVEGALRDYARESGGGVATED